jgi:AhpD family alkylhydroperoxidase
LLTRNIHGVDDGEFQRVRSQFNDSQIVELTLTTCLWNYFSRLCAGLDLPLEAWVRADASQSTLVAASVPFEPPFARIALISDDELAAFKTASTPAPTTPNNPGLGIRVANSKRAMMRSPLFGTAWFDYWQAVREGTPKASGTAAEAPASIGREMLLQVSFAVSMANGCRYCTLHQVQGLRRLNVDPAKLVAMKKDDNALTPRERIAVNFARKLTRDPASVTDADYTLLQDEFGVRGAGEVLLQTCAFNFMNRFTDGLNLPSEDEAIQTYREVYGQPSVPAARRALRQEP